MTDKEKNNRVNALAMTFLEELQMRPNLFADQILRAYKAGYHQSEKDSLPEEPVSEDLEKELILWNKNHFKKEDTYEKYNGFYLTNNSQLDLAKHFFELGLKAQKEE